MQVAIISEGITVESVEALCHSCYSGVQVRNTALCGDCLDAANAWEVFEDRMGYKPRGWTDAQLLAWLREQPYELPE
jgi:hypothetical protein